MSFVLSVVNLHHNPYSAKTHTPGPILRGMGYIRVDCNTPVQNESISGICAVPMMPSNARSGCHTHEMGGVWWQLGPIEHCGVDVGHWDVVPMGWEVEAQRPLACCAGIGHRQMGVGPWWAMVGVGSRVSHP